MNNEKKVHIFLGAPANLTQRRTSAKEAVADGSSKKWLQCQFLYDNKSLNAIPRKCSSKESQKHFDWQIATLQLENQYGQTSTSKSEEGIIVETSKHDIPCYKDLNVRKVGKRHREKLSNKKLLNSGEGLKITEERDCAFVSPNCSGENVKTSLKSDNESRQSEKNGLESQDFHCRITEQNAPLKEDCPEFLCHSLMEYFQNIFPAEEQESCFRCTSVKEDLSSDAEFLSVLTASQAALFSWGRPENQFNTQDLNENVKVKLKKNVDVNEQSHQSLTSTHNFIRHFGQSASETMYRQDNSSENTPELYSLFSDQQLSTDEAINGRTSEQSFSPSTKWSNDDVEINIEPYNGGVLYSQVSDNAEWSLKRSVEVAKEPEEVKQVTETPRSPVCLDSDPPSSKKIKTMNSEKISDLGHYLKAWRDQWLTPNIGLIETQQLKNCTDRTRKYHVLVTVLFRCLLKEIQIKSGTFAGCRVPIATILVTDQSGVIMKIALWRAAAFWALSVFPGDVLLVTENTYTYCGKKQQKMVLSVEQVKGHPSTLTLWGSKIAWHSRIQKKLGHVWDFQNLLVFQNSITGDLELHTTPWSSCECLFDDDARAIAFRNKYQSSEAASIKVMDLSTLLHSRYSGNVQLKTHIVAMQWNTHSTHIPLFKIDAFTPMEAIFGSLIHFTYSGCGSCGSELEFDENGIYQQCIPCLPNSTVKIFYRPTVLVLTDQDYQIDVLISSKLMEKIFLNIPPASLSKLIGPSDNVTYGMVIADLCYSLFADPADCYRLTLQSQFHLDENSITMKLEFYLLDFCPDH
ncbi:shieldin complex subunit 2 isoform X3 [Rhincodon typus]|uniref:shieldin complex subunit 2 isoform X3 n=1 Tax=Rhincodon typus TaxID=259920 RepID=UPI00202EDA84|nr:shieldin complex subunit 2 isoform X3 [Rhincodon typus]